MNVVTTLYEAGTRRERREEKKNEFNKHTHSVSPCPQNYSYGRLIYDAARNKNDIICRIRPVHPTKSDLIYIYLCVCLSSSLFFLSIIIFCRFKVI